MKKEIKVKLKTITPLWTGDAWGENKEIRPSSLMGSLRFWFYIYCKSFNMPTEKLNNNRVPSDSIDDYVKVYNKNNKSKKTFDSLLLQEMENNNIDYTTALKNILKNIKLPLISQIFGCTGWNSQIKIQNIDFTERRINKSDINFKYLYDKINTITKNSCFWSNKLLFNNKDQITVFSDIMVDLIIDKLYENEIKKFLKFYEDKIILVGGKKSFGFGFCTLTTDEDLENVNLKDVLQECFKVNKIKINNLSDNNIILGFNLKHYQRLKENKKFRKNNFGKQSKASNFFFSLHNGNYENVYIIGFKEENINDNLFNNLMNNYSNFEDENDGKR